MKQEIIKFYDINSPPKVKHLLEELHIETLRMNYDPRYFVGLTSKELRKRKIELLTGVQNIVDRWEFY